MAAVKVVALIMVVSAMIGAGLQVDRRHLLVTLRDYPLLARALFANIIVLPLAAFAILRLAHTSQEVATGILLMAMAPGVPFLVNSAGRKQGGSLAFALEIALLFSAVSVITLPLTAGLLLPSNELAHIPVLKVIGPLIVFQFIPVVAAVLFAPRLTPERAEQIGRVLHIVFLVAAAILAVILAPKIGASIAAVYGFGNLLAIAAIGVVALAAGWLMAGPERQYRRTLSIATLLRNISMCLLIATNAFSSESLVAPAVLAYFAVTFIISIPVRILYKRTSAAVAAPAA